MTNTTTTTHDDDNHDHNNHNTNSSLLTFPNRLPDSRLGQRHDTIEEFYRHQSYDHSNGKSKEYTLVVVTETTTTTTTTTTEPLTMKIQISNNHI